MAAKFFFFRVTRSKQFEDYTNSGRHVMIIIIGVGYNLIDKIRSNYKMYRDVLHNLVLGENNAEGICLEKVLRRRQLVCRV